MGIQDLQTFIENLEGGAVSVDLLKIARNVTQRQQPQHPVRKMRAQNKLHLIVDAECCLDRFYGGYFSDWACGGQWNRMVQFLSLLIQAIDRANIELAVVFNGTLESSRMTEWIQEQASVRQKVSLVLKHINTKATPPPKIWWTPPTCLRTALRMAFRHLSTALLCTMDDHHREVIAFCREYGFHGLLADDAEYAAFDPPRYFSSEHMKLTYKGSLETKEFMLSELQKTLNLNQEQICVLAALLGNFILPESEMQDFYKRIGVPVKSSEDLVEPIIKLLAEYVQSLPSPSNMDALVSEIFGSTEDKRAVKLRQSVQYYLNGTANGFLKYCALPVSKRDMKKKNLQNNNNTKMVKSEEHELDTSGFASETTEQEQESLQNYKLATANVVLPTDMVYTSQESETSAKSSPHEDTSSPSSDNSRFVNQSNGSCSTINSTSASNGATPSCSTTTKGNNNAASSSNSSHSNSGPTSPKHVSPDNMTANVVTPNVSADVLRTASLRHQKGLMAPWILHVLTNREVRLPCLLEDETYREFPPIHEIYQRLRQRVYAVLFNLHHLRYMHSKRKETGEVPEDSPLPDVLVKEWVYSHANPYQYPELVKAEALPWAVPTLRRLWFGPAVDDKRRRIRALLSCLDSDTPLILNTSYVPQHMLVMACVLRYIMSLEKPILRRQELDAFICQAFNPDLMNSSYLQDLTLNIVSSRGVQLAALFMQGVELALLANDACGAPLPWLLCCPWLYFDGKLFHHTLARSAHSKNILELCENHIDRVVKVERMRKAILEGLEFKFAKMPLPPFQEDCWIKIPPSHCIPSVPIRPSRGAGAVRQRPMPARGGQLQVGGVVVGSWGANYGYMARQPQQQQPPQHQQQQQQMMGGGFRGRGRGVGNFFSFAGGGRGQRRQQQQQFERGKKPGPPTYNVNRKNNLNKRRNSSNKPKNPVPRGRGMTVKTDVGDLPASEILQENLNANDATYEDCRSEHKGQGDGPAAGQTVDASTN